MMNNFRKTAVLMAVLLLLTAVSPAAFAAGRELDTARLESLMDVAGHLQKGNYTADTWQALDEAMTAADAALNGSSQYDVDVAAGQMSTALSSMVSMDFTALNVAMAAADTWVDAQEGADILWDQLLRLVEQEQAARSEGDQAKVDQLAVQISETLEKLKAATIPSTESGTDNVPWIILFAVSLVFNAALLVLMLMRTRTVKKCQKDDVPLVEYDIDDDMV